ncbi:1-hydroxycarotenoid 3,4-desaturase CrtD [Stappia stellulata]|uniref:1-hydroxycarotenoid 3,4-desaturase CrtD n=1 Tax=Stappia stellulata TaxID=71235 RepID=UPI000410F4FF|nr:1-hydroxycarotenoid 3,4-desaturase CrtD [Stappia stellulata]
MTAGVRRERVVVVGAGVAGLSAAVSLASAGHDVHVVERAGAPGGKMRQVEVGGTPVDAGPTVFTMKWAFDRLMAQAGTTLEAEVGLTRAGTLARHGWGDGSRLDLFADANASAAAIEQFAGPREAEGYRRFCKESAAVFATLKDTYIAAERPDPVTLARRVGMGNLSQMLALKPFSTLWSALGAYFRDPRLRQLFARYATYCGSSPFQAPATLMLVAHVEQDGVWLIEGGMHALACALAEVAGRQGARIDCGRAVTRIETGANGVCAVHLADGERLAADAVIFNGDFSALASGRVEGVDLGEAPVKPSERSLSAMTWAVKAEVRGFPLARHTVLFSDAYRREFDEIFRKGRVPADPTVYLCAQGRDDAGARTRDAVDDPRDAFLCLINAPALGDRAPHTSSESATCLEAAVRRMARCGLALESATMESVATTPADFERMFPGSGGALYGRASHGWMASFRRPGARTRIPGLYLAGGSVHPGPGVPMASLSGQLAAASLVADRASTRRFHRVAISGGTSTA